MFGVCAQPPEWKWLRRRPPTPPPSFPWLALLLAVLAVELCMLPLRRPRVAEPLPEVEGAVLITADPAWGEKPVRRIIPPRPDPNWAKPPCESWQTELAGACWGKMDPEKIRPPCPGSLYEHQGACYAPIVKAARPPSSIGK